MTPPPDSHSSGDAPHRHRDIAESFGSEADRYDRARPRYPRAIADSVLDGLAGRRVLDVGIGTGISALPFREAGADILGVEVDPRMADLARSRGFDVEVASFDDWDAGGAIFDAVIAGQTWHWIDPAAGAAKAAGLLRPGGRLALFWNLADPEPAVASGFADVYRSVDTGLPFTPWAEPALDSYEAIIARATEGIRDSGGFTEAQRESFDTHTTITREEWLDQVPTMGGHNRIPDDRITELLDGLGNVIDDNGGSFVMNYATMTIVADRTA